ncbi:MAG: hypothetical protein ABSA78_13300 [Candidatus Sulfotelmatobacter sp.]|jgi:hypothetical protein
MVTLIKIVLPSGQSSGDVEFVDSTGKKYEGTVDTDLAPGTYNLRVDKAQKLWVIFGTDPGLRFNVELQGADPWALSYAPVLRLEVAANKTMADLAEYTVDLGGDDPSSEDNYIENVVKSVGIPIWGGSFYLYRKQVPITGLDQDSIVIPRTMPHLDDDPIAGAVEIQLVYKSDVWAEQAVQNFGAPAYSYYVGVGGHIYPTVISDTSAPRLCTALRRMLEQERRDARAAQALTIDLGLWAAGARSPIKTANPATPAEIAAESWRVQARVYASDLRAAGKSVRVNLGGTGEVADAINVNPLKDQRVRDIPRLIVGKAEEIADVFDPESVDEIVSNNIVRGQVNWVDAAKSAFKVMKSGAKIKIAPYAGQSAEHLAEIESALRQAGFKSIVRDPVTSLFITAVK